MSMNPAFTPAFHQLQNETLAKVAKQDCAVLDKKEQTYKGSWRKRGGIGAFMMLARKWDRLENIAEAASKAFLPKPLDPGDGKKHETYSGYVHQSYDIFAILASEDSAGEGGNDGSLLAEIRDLRRYLMLVEAFHLITKTSYRQEIPATRGTATSENVLKAEQAIAGLKSEKQIREENALPITQNRAGSFPPLKPGEIIHYPLGQSPPAGTPVGTAQRVGYADPPKIIELPDGRRAMLLEEPDEPTVEQMYQDPDSQMEHAAANCPDREEPLPTHLL